MAIIESDWFSHIESAPRVFRNGQEAQSIGYFPRKKNWIKSSFLTQNFSFILSGHGFYELEGKLLPVRAPMVLTQSPGIEMNYGPEGEWEELYIIYPAKDFDYFTGRGLLKNSLWKIQQHGEILKQIRDLIFQLNNQDASKNSSDFYDRIDLSLEKLILYSRQESTLPRETELQIFIQDIHREIERNCSGDFDFHKLAEERGYSPSSFRRCWEDLYSRTPGQELIEIKIRRACRLLAETELPIKEIAHKLNYSDSLYFSRLFKKKRGESPGTYRRRTRTPYLIY